MAAPRVKHEGRTTTTPGLSRATLEFCDWLIDGVTLAVNHPDFESEAKRIAAAKKEITAALIAAGGEPVAAQRAASG